MSREILPVAEEHHRALLDAIEHREGSRAESLGREHARLTRRHLEAALTDQNFVDTLPGARLVKVRTPESINSRAQLIAALPASAPQRQLPLVHPTVVFWRHTRISIVLALGSLDAARADHQ
jgi:hypothetical protein